MTFLGQVELASGGAGGVLGSVEVVGGVPAGLITGLTSGQALFGSAAGGIGQNANLFWDNANERLGIGIGSAPLAGLHVKNKAGSVGVACIAQSGHASDINVVRVLNTTGSEIVRIQNNLTSVITGPASFSAGIFDQTLTQNGIVFADGSHRLMDNINFVWIDSTQRCGIGTGAPAQQLHVVGRTRIVGGIEVTSTKGLGANIHKENNPASTTYPANTTTAIQVITPESFYLSILPSRWTLPPRGAVGIQTEIKFTFSNGGTKVYSNATGASVDFQADNDYFNQDTATCVSVTFQVNNTTGAGITVDIDTFKIEGWEV